MRRLLPLLLISCNAASLPVGEPKPKVTERTGAELFAAECAACHGDDGISGRAPNLAQRVPALSDDLLKSVIVVGTENMPPRNVQEPELTVLMSWLRETFGA